MRKYCYLLLIVIAVSSCHKKEEKSVTEYTVVQDTVCITEQSPLAKKIKTGKAALQTYYQTFSSSGVVKAIPTNYAQIASPFVGRITKSYIHLGQKVSAGSPIFEISSSEFFEDVKSYCQSQQEMRNAYRVLKREKDLFSHKVGVEKEVEDAQLEYELKKRDFQNAQAALSVYHISTNQIRLGKPLIVRSPLSGEIVSDDIVIGQYLKDDAQPVATVANLNKVWMVAHVKEKDISLISNLKEVNISLVAMPDKEIKGKIYHISQMMDEDTHSVEVIIECDNSRRWMKPGMYGYVKLTDKAVQRIMIPSSAILQEENSTYVFVRTGRNKYMKKEVQTTIAPNHQVVINSGLSAGEEVITEGAFYLNNIL
jgi:cobalt-zinc-cadmium efflux system membrane fusion protein